ncbi:hypothetical protein IWX49DRAFT_363925 [Phyllosticta citricarpa]
MRFFTFARRVCSLSTGLSLGHGEGVKGTQVDMGCEVILVQIATSGAAPPNSGPDPAIFSGHHFRAQTLTSYPPTFVSQASTYNLHDQLHPPWTFPDLCNQSYLSVFDPSPALFTRPTSFASPARHQN